MGRKKKVKMPYASYEAVASQHYVLLKNMVLPGNTISLELSYDSEYRELWLRPLADDSGTPFKIALNRFSMPAGVIRDIRVEGYTCRIPVIPAADGWYYLALNDKRDVKPRAGSAKWFNEVAERQRQRDLNEINEIYGEDEDE